MRLDGTIVILGGATVAETDMGGDGVAEPAVQVTIAISLDKLKALKAEPDPTIKKRMAADIGTALLVALRDSQIAGNLA